MICQNDMISAAMICVELSEEGVINNCHVIESDVKSTCYAGGIVSYNNGTIYNCSNAGNIVTINNEYSEDIGGIAGYNTGTIYNCCNTGNIENNEYEKTGGIAGYNAGNIYNCYNTGKVSSISISYVGGIIGYNKTGRVSNCYNTGMIQYTGSSEESPRTYGGIIGAEYKGNIKNCYWDEAVILNGFQYESSSEAMMTVEKNVVSKPLEELYSQKFVDTLNANRGTNAGWAKWELRDGIPTFTPLYWISLKSTKYGTAKANYTAARNGQTVTVTLTARKNYVPASVKVKTADGKSVKVSKKKANKAGTKVSYTFRMPKGKVTITPSFKKK